MTVSFEEAERIRAEYRKMMAQKEAEKAKPKEETKAKLPDETVSSEKSEESILPVDEYPEYPTVTPVEDKPKKKRGRPKKKSD